MTEFRILAISGSLRKGSFNTAALRAAQEVAPPGVVIEIADISDMPMYNDDIREKAYPEPVQRLRKKIAEADAVLFATPEYNYSVAAPLKNAFDWVSRPREPAPDEQAGRHDQRFRRTDWRHARAIPSAPHAGFDKFASAQRAPGDDRQRPAEVR